LRGYKPADPKDRIVKKKKGSMRNASLRENTLSRRRNNLVVEVVRG